MLEDETNGSQVLPNEKADLCVSCVPTENQEKAKVLRELLCEKWEIERV